MRYIVFFAIGFSLVSASISPIAQGGNEVCEAVGSFTCGVQSSRICNYDPGCDTTCYTCDGSPSYPEKMCFEGGPGCTPAGSVDCGDKWGIGSCYSGEICWCVMPPPEYKQKIGTCSFSGCTGV